MWFNSFGFWLFFSLAAVGCKLLRRRGVNAWLLACSYFFYGCWDWRFLGLIAACTLVNFQAGLAISKASSRSVAKRWVWLSFGFSLGVLGVFKYFNFFAGELGEFLAWVGLGGEGWTFHILLPAGISFFTFQALSYTMDVYRGQTAVTDDLLDFALFISFFPQLVAGPIERSSHLLPQVHAERPRCDYGRFQRGLYWVITGMFLKVSIADNMAWLANYAFETDPSQLLPLDVLFGVYAFAFQIYGDFAGYSAIAIGTACWLGFDLMINFRRPYFATNPREFWQRWHISLSSWLRDYLYIPLGGNRGSRLRTGWNLMLTMVFGGLWHGAAWTFVIWGAVHGVWLSVHRWLFASRGNGPENSGKRRGLQIHKVVQGVGTFHLVCLTWLLFRADSLSKATAMLARLGREWTVTPFAKTSLALMVFFVLPWMLYEVWSERKCQDEAILVSPWWIRTVFYAYLLLMLLFFPPPAPSEFIYFRF